MRAICNRLDAIDTQLDARDDKQRAEATQETLHELGRALLARVLGRRYDPPWVDGGQLVSLPSKTTGVVVKGRQNTRRIGD